MNEPFCFPTSWRWLDRPPLHLQTGLTGHVVVVLYWRLGCVHSRVALHELTRATQGLVGQPIAVVAVHVPTCDAERDESRLRRELARLPGTVTVAIAPGPGAPESLGLQRLPTILLVDAKGVVRVRAIGVPRRYRFRAAIDALLDEAKRIDSPVEVPFVPSVFAAGSALQPTAIAVDGSRLWVASAGQRRVFALDHDGSVSLVVGSGEQGADDGSADHVSFSLPVAMCLHDDHLVVADAHTHTLRAIDRESGDVTTWCGTGLLGADDMGGSYGRDQALSSPSGVVSRDGGLYVSQAGLDQLWQVDPMTGSAMAWLGGRAVDHAVDFEDHASSVLRDAFDEPLGVAIHDDELWVVSGRGRKLSAVDLSHIQSRTVGSGFQRPVAAVVHGDRVLVADAWAGSVLAVSLADGTLATLLDSRHGLLEPVSLAISGDVLYLADVGVDAVFTCDLAQDELQLSRVSLAQVPTAACSAARSSAWAPRAIVLPGCSLQANGDVALHMLMPGYADGTAVVVDVVDEATPVLAAARHQATEVCSERLTVLLPVVASGEGVLRIRLRLPTATMRYVLPVSVSESGELEATLVLPRDAGSESGTN